MPDLSSENVDQSRARIAETREQIDQLDRAIAEMLASRVRYAHDIGRAKAALGLPIYDATREATIVSNVSGHLEALGLTPYEVPVLDIFRTLVLVCRHAQDDPTIHD